MKIVLAHHNATNIKRIRHICRSASVRQNITLRNGRLYTMRYNPGRQPRTASQQNSWSIFTEANRLATADFRDPSRRAYWNSKLKTQSRYKTARGLAKAFYIAQLRSRRSRRAMRLCPPVSVAPSLHLSNTTLHICHHEEASICRSRAAGLRLAG